MEKMRGGGCNRGKRRGERYNSGRGEGCNRGRRGGYNTEKRRGEGYMKQGEYTREKRMAERHYVLLHWCLCGVGEVYGAGVVDEDVNATKPVHRLVDSVLQL